MQLLKSKTKLKNKNKFIGLYFVIPSLIGVAIFTLLPSIDVFIMSFQNSISREFSGLSNYGEIFSNTAFKLASKNTIKFTVVCIPLLLIISFIIALFLNKFIKSSQILRTVFLIPIAVPIASVVLIWNIFFNESGVFSVFVENFLGLQSRDWMDSKASFWILVLSYIWKNLGYNIILWLAGLNSISKSLYEASKIDGASSGKILFKITVPLLKPTIYTITVLSLLNSFKVFREAYLVAGDYPHKSMYLLQHLFNNWFKDMDFGKMAAGSVVMGLIILIFILLLQKAWENKD